MKKLTAYSAGFALSLVLTGLPVLMLWMHEAGNHAFPSHGAMYAGFALFAVLQLFVQLSFFLHIDEEERPRWNLTVLCFALLVVGIVVGGTLWIMNDLSHMKHDAAVPFINGEITPENSND